MNQYQIEKVVGQGSFGKALLCKRKKDGKKCIIKEISIAKMSRKEALQTEQESTLLARLSHPNIVTFWESFSSNSKLHIVMEFADGGDLDQYIKNFAKSNRGREMPEKQVLNMFVQLSLAIKHIHDRKILHRDLKSQNVFMTASGILKLGDFGVSRVLRQTSELAATQIGTPYYMSPEIMDRQRYNSKTDIWSLGVILYELMCLRLPFGGNSMRELVQNIMRKNPPPPSSAAYSKELRELCRDTLVKNPRQRCGINTILSRPIIRDRISNFLDDTKKNMEFNHTILHGVDVLRSRMERVHPEAPAAAPATAAAAPSAAPVRPVAPTAAAPSVPPPSRNPIPSVGASAVVTPRNPLLPGGGGGGAPPSSKSPAVGNAALAPVPRAVASNAAKENYFKMLEIQKQQVAAKMKQQQDAQKAREQYINREREKLMQLREQEKKREADKMTAEAMRAKEAKLKLEQEKQKMIEAARLREKERREKEEIRRAREAALKVQQDKERAIELSMKKERDRVAQQEQLDRFKAKQALAEKERAQMMEAVRIRELERKQQQEAAMKVREANLRAEAELKRKLDAEKMAEKEKQRLLDDERRRREMQQRREEAEQLRQEHARQRQADAERLLQIRAAAESDDLVSKDGGGEKHAGGVAMYIDKEVVVKPDPKAERDKKEKELNVLRRREEIKRRSEALKANEGGLEVHNSNSHASERGSRTPPPSNAAVPDNYRGRRGSSPSVGGQSPAPVGGPISVSKDDAHISRSPKSDKKNAERNSVGGGASPWLAQLENQMGSLQNQVKHLQVVKSPGKGAIVSKLDDEKSEDDASAANDDGSVNSDVRPVIPKSAVVQESMRILEDRKNNREKQKQEFAEFLNTQRELAAKSPSKILLQQMRDSQNRKKKMFQLSDLEGNGKGAVSAGGGNVEVFDAKRKAPAPSRPPVVSSSMDAKPSRKAKAVVRSLAPLNDNNKVLKKVSSGGGGNNPFTRNGSKGDVLSNAQNDDKRGQNFSVKEFRQQKEKDRQDLKRLMLERKRELMRQKVEHALDRPIREGTNEDDADDDATPRNDRAPHNDDDDDDNEPDDDIFNSREKGEGDEFDTAPHSKRDFYIPHRVGLDGSGDVSGVGGNGAGGADALGGTFSVLNLTEDAPVEVDERGALEYSLMLEQMQQILQMPTVAHAPKKKTGEVAPVSAEKKSEVKDDQTKDAGEKESSESDAKTDDDDTKDLPEDDDEFEEEASVDVDNSNSSDDEDDSDSADDDDSIGSEFTDEGEDIADSPDGNALKLGGTLKISMSLDATDDQQRQLRAIEKQSLKETPSGTTGRDDSAINYKAGGTLGGTRKKKSNKKVVERYKEKRIIKLRTNLVAVLGEEKFLKAMSFLADLPSLNDTAATDDYLLNEVEQLIGEDNLPLLDDLFQLLSLDS